MTVRKLSCGVLVTDGTLLLLGHATWTPRWDIPKGMAEADEAPEAAAVRELREETGLVADPAALRPLGRHAYLRDKDLVLFSWRPAVLPDPLTLRCTSVVMLPGGHGIPELDRFGLFSFAEAGTMVGRNLLRVLAEVWPRV